MPKWGAMYVVLNEEDYIESSIRSLPFCVDEIIVLRTTSPWHGPDVALDETPQRVAALGDARVRLIEGVWRSEVEQRNAALKLAKESGWEFGIVVDGDEVYEQDKLDEAVSAIEADSAADAWRTPLWTYWKSPLWRIDPPEPSLPVFALRITQTVEFTWLREPDCGSDARVYVPERPMLHHFSYAKPEHKIWEKIQAFEHSHEIRQDWWEHTWKGWDSNHDLQDLNPVYPDCYRRAVYSGPNHLPKAMRSHAFVLHGVNGLTTLADGT